MADETPSTNFDFTPKLRIWWDMRKRTNERWWDINIYQLHRCAGPEAPPQLQKPLIQTPSCLEDGHLWIIDDPQIGRQVEVLFLTGNRMKTSSTTFSKKTCESFLVLAEAMSPSDSTWSWSSYAQWRPGPFCPLNPSNNKWRCIGARESGWTAGATIILMILDPDHDPNSHHEWWMVNDVTLPCGCHAHPAPIEVTRVVISVLTAFPLRKWRGTLRRAFLGLSPTCSAW